MGLEVKKRSGEIVPFSRAKIEAAVNKAFIDVDGDKNEAIASKIASSVENTCSTLDEPLTVEEIQDIVEACLMNSKRTDVAKSYIRYRYKREMAREARKTYKSILDLVEDKNDYLKDENSNKSATVASTQRDYMAGEVSKDITEKLLLPSDIVEAHKAGIIHFHDEDYFAQHIHNCCLVNLEDMLQNGTVINKTLIEKPHSFATACNIATQIMAVVASGQYGGQSISLAHLVPFVDASRKKIRASVIDELDSIGAHLTEKEISKIVEERLSKEIERGVQTMQYQINTLNTSNGQTPFVTVFMYIGEVPEEQKNDMALVIKEVLNQRIQGVKNEKGVWITPAFPKLIYVLEEDNVTENSRFWDVTVLAAKCTAKRLVPDYISEKKMKELKLSKGELPGEGDCYPCMGCRSFLTPDKTGNGYDNVAKAKNYKPNEPKYYGRLTTKVEPTLNCVNL